VDWFVLEFDVILWTVVLWSLRWRCDYNFSVLYYHSRI